jgi:NAD(P)-dependent dehydrogenase (short-subunit alcohol dehydrogenase family)/pimeloyl-ACP methyl ester carboxylesterase
MLMDAVRSRAVTSGGLRLAVSEQGDSDAPTVLLVHGYPDNSSVWDGVAERLATRFHVIRYDVRGTGGSEQPGARAGYALDRLAEDLAAVVRMVSPAAPVHLVAHDWGSIQAWHAVTEPRYAKLFASYTSISGPCLDHIDYWMRKQVRRFRLRSVVRQLLHSWYIGFFQLPVLPELAWSVPMLRHKLHATKRDAKNGIELYRANMLSGRTATERFTSVPVQQLALTRDAFVTPALLAAAEPWCARLWRRELPYEHWAPRSHPRQIAELVTEFVDHINGEPAGRGLRGAEVTGDSGDFAGKLVLVTGAGSGIGRAAALAFAAQGADVLAVDVDEVAANLTALDARKSDVNANALWVDVSDEKAVAGLAEQVRAEFGVPDIVLANAGIAVAGPFMATAEEDWRRLLGVNLWGVIHTLRAFGALQVERGRGGHLVVTASAAAFTPWPVLSAYAVSKAAVLSLAQSLRTELHREGIGVSAICPGLVSTNITSVARFAGQDPETERLSQQRATKGLHGRHFPPERVAAAILDAVRRNRAVVPVTPEGWLAAIGSRISPNAVRLAGRWSLGASPWNQRG